LESVLGAKCILLGHTLTVRQYQNKSSIVTDSPQQNPMLLNADNIDNSSEDTLKTFLASNKFQEYCEVNRDFNKRSQGSLLHHFYSESEETDSADKIKLRALCFSEEKGELYFAYNPHNLERVDKSSNLRIRHKYSEFSTASKSTYNALNLRDAYDYEQFFDKNSGLRSLRKRIAF